MGVKKYFSHLQAQYLHNDGGIQKVPSQFLSLKISQKLSAKAAVNKVIKNAL